MRASPAARARTVLGAFALFVLTLLLVADASSAAEDDEPPKVRFGLSLEYEHFSYVAGTGGRLVDARNALTALPKIDWTPSESVLLHLSALLRQDFSEEERSRVDAHEGFLSLDRERWSLKVGRQFVTWGRADSLRPTDVSSATTSPTSSRIGRRPPTP